jgi:predicted dehydrogenase
MSYDDLKVIEAALFLQSISEGKQLGAAVTDAAATARVLAAVARSAGSGRWESVEQCRVEEVN